MRQAREFVSQLQSYGIGQADGDSVADTEIARMLGVAFAIGADKTLKEKLRKLARAGEKSPFAVVQPGGVWLIVNGDKLTAERRRPKGVAIVEQEALRGDAEGIAEALRAALARSSALADAAKLIGTMLGPAEVPSRQEFAALLPWIPVIEQVAYKTAASIAVTLDLLRPHFDAHLRSDGAIPPELVNEYWQRVHAMAQLTLLASDTQAAPWLAEMADQFAWINWTPTFTLLRERTTWLAACAARSALAFGGAVVGKYLAILEAARHPFKAFDALFGLTAIALANPRLRASLGREIQSLQCALALHGNGPGRYVEQAYDDAMALIEGSADWARSDTEEIRALGWQGSSRGLATRPALWTDPAVITQSGHLLGFVILPTAIATPLAKFNPDQTIGRSGTQITSTGIVEQVLRAAWEPIAPVSSVLH